MSNLIPTPIVDKNGVASVRHKKPAASSSDASNIPAPYGSKTASSGSAREKLPTLEEEQSKNSNAFTRWRNRKRRDKVTEELVTALYPEFNDPYRGERVEEMKATLEVSMSTDEISLAADIASLVTRDEVPEEDAKRDREALIWSLRTSLKQARNGVSIRALHTYSDWLKDHHGEAENLIMTIENVIDLGLITNGGNDGINHFDTYMAATIHPSFQNFDIIYVWRKDFMNAAVMYPDQIDKIVDYMKERSGFDVDGFEQYANASTPLADGSL